MRRSITPALRSLCVVSLLAGAGTTSLGCTGTLDAGPAIGGRHATPSDPRGGVCSDAIEASPGGLVRLTPDEYVSSVRDLVGAPSLAIRVTDAAPILTERGARELRDAAEAVLDARAEWTAEVVPCDTDGDVAPACLDAFFDGFAARAYRRPLTAEERAGLRETFATASAELSPADAMDVLVEVVLLSPQVVYRQELGVADASLPANVHRLTDHEVAARLSYALWGTTPDGALLARASEGGLSSAAEVQDEAQRMVADPRARRMLQGFVGSWLGLDGSPAHGGLETASKDEALYPDDSPALRAAMRTEIEELVRWSLEEDGGRIDTLLTTRRAYLNGPLADLYGVRHDGGGDDWRWLELPEGERAGLLTRAGFLSVYAGSRVSSPIRRGVFVLEEVVCSPLGDPPPAASDVVIDGDPVIGDDGNPLVRTVREDVHARTRGAECAGCHDTINPVGFAFEHYDALGIFRTTEQISGLSIDASGALFRAGDADGPVEDAVEMSERLAGSERARTCMADRLVTDLYGAPAASGLSDCARSAARDAALRTGRIEDVVLAIVSDDAFRHVYVEDTSSPVGP